MFQYISCYSLSTISWNTILIWRSFNTSHVTLYRCGCCMGSGVDKFQYISCYSLSRAADEKTFIQSSFNTSHVTLYRNQNIWKTLDITSFNTSHVTLYPCPAEHIKRTYFVSIHLMLLFIQSEKDFFLGCINVSIHLMLLFIRLSGRKTHFVNSVSIHLMLLFIIYT